VIIARAAGVHPELRPGSDPAADGGELELLLMRRHPQLRFMGGMFVFPGGALHADDEHPDTARRVKRAARPWPGSRGEEHCRAFALAAIRETCEESGLLLGLPGAAAPTRQTVREKLLSGAPFARALSDSELFLDLDVLIPLSRWITPRGLPIRFDTRFYLAAAPPDQHAEPDLRESVELVWCSARAALARERAGTMPLPVPTLATLAELANFRSLDALIAYAQSRPAPTHGPDSEPTP
jgi:8-oxo-dGTP pyrophosphatase MutT (NUDIX family)